MTLGDLASTREECLRQVLGGTKQWMFLLPWLETMHAPTDYRLIVCGECRHVTAQESGTIDHQHQTVLGCLSVRMRALAKG